MLRVKVQKLDIPSHIKARFSESMAIKTKSLMETKVFLRAIIFEYLLMQTLFKY